MQIKRSVTRFFGALILPALTIAVVSYFGAYAIWGERGLLQLEDVQAKLGIQQAQLAQVAGERDRLSHRIQLMEGASADPDLVEELARGQIDGRGSQSVAGPRTSLADSENPFQEYVPEEPPFLRRCCALILRIAKPRQDLANGVLRL